MPVGDYVAGGVSDIKHYTKIQSVAHVKVKVEGGTQSRENFFKLTQANSTPPAFPHRHDRMRTVHDIPFDQQFRIFEFAL